MALEEASTQNQVEGGIGPWDSLTGGSADPTESCEQEAL